jgi:hypothetical protein
LPPVTGTREGIDKAVIKGEGSTVGEERAASRASSSHINDVAQR